MRWEYHKSQEKFIDLLKKYGVHKVQTSDGNDSLLILLNKYAYPFLSDIECKPYREAIERLLMFCYDGSLNVNYQNRAAHTALHYAIAHFREDYLEPVALLLEHNTDVSLLDAEKQDFLFTHNRCKYISMLSSKRKRA